MAEHDFETISSETLHTGAIFALRRDQVRMPGGGIVTREVVEHFGAVAIVAMDDNGNIPMVYQYRHTYGRRLWGATSSHGRPGAAGGGRAASQHLAGAGRSGHR
ncbi:ADP-ribose pyrophosphatase, partial [Mycobacterium tuberculosis variant bovis B2 7505]